MTPTQRPTDLEDLSRAIQDGNIPAAVPIMFRLKWVQADERIGTTAIELLRQPGLDPSVKAGLVCLVIRHFRRGLLVAAQLATETQDDANALFSTVIELNQMVGYPDWVVR